MTDSASAFGGTIAGAIAGCAIGRKRVYYNDNTHAHRQPATWRGCFHAILTRRGVKSTDIRAEQPGSSSKAMRIERRDGETVDQLLRRFNKVVVAERITKTFREKMHFVSKSEQRKEKARRAERNRRKRAVQTR
ncbi:MAG TPA: 30S ribosomal protein S21 [Roseiflexaceae bacterium]|nr:30S ribosomal protein S21 [Roseiflexaceae bacterium]